MKGRKPQSLFEKRTADFKGIPGIGRLQQHEYLKEGYLPVDIRYLDILYMQHEHVGGQFGKQMGVTLLQNEGITIIVAAVGITSKKLINTVTDRIIGRKCVTKAQEISIQQRKRQIATRDIDFTVTPGDAGTLFRLYILDSWDNCYIGCLLCYDGSSSFSRSGKVLRPA
jgi:hypothetical protein